MRSSCRRIALVALALLQTQTFRLAQTASSHNSGVADPQAAIAGCLQPFVDQQTIAGAVTLVAHPDQIVHLDAIGFSDLDRHTPMKTNSLFWIASMTKPITATAVMMLADEGRLSIDSPVVEYLPEFKDPWLVASRGEESLTLKRPDRPITLRHLLTHTSGIGDFSAPRPTCSLAELVVGYSQQPLKSPPGSRWQYSNAGINTLGRVVEVVSGQPYEEFLEERIFEPLAMNDTTFWPTLEQRDRLAKSYRPRKSGSGLEETSIYFIQGELSSPDRTPFPAGGLFSTAADLSRFYRMILNGGVADGSRLLSQEAIREMTRTQTGELETGFTPGMSFGLGWAVVKDPQGVTGMLSKGSFGHGGAYGTQAWVDPQKDLILVLMIQRAQLPNADNSEIRRAFQEAAISIWH